MFVVAFVLVLGAAGLLIAGLATTSQTLVWGSIGASIVAALVLVLLVSVRRRRAEKEAGAVKTVKSAGSAPTRRTDDPPARTPARDDREDRDTREVPPVRERTREPQHPEPSGSDLAARIAALEAELAAATGSTRAAAAPQPAAAESDEPAEPDEPVDGLADGVDPEDEPPEEDASMTDSVLVVDLDAQVFVVDGRPRYHLWSCEFLAGREGIPLPVREAREDGFTPCAWCGPDTVTAAGERARLARRR